MWKYTGTFLNDFALPDAEVERGTDVVAGHVIVIVDLSSIGVLIIKLTVGAVVDAAIRRVMVSAKLHIRQVFDRPVRLQ